MRMKEESLELNEEFHKMIGERIVQTIKIRKNLGRRHS
jgi:hypothetical protein